MGMVSFDSFYWSLDAYKERITEIRDAQEAKAAWDELEKSVVYRLADEVQVGIRRIKVELVVEKLV